MKSSNMKSSNLLFVAIAAFSLAACTKPASTGTTTIAAPAPTPEPAAAQPAVAQPDGTVAGSVASAQGTPPVADAQATDDSDAMAEPGQPATTAKARPRFNDADADHDNRLSQKEAAAIPFVARRFGEIDTDHDGYVTRKELRAARERIKAMRAARNGGAPANPGSAG